MVSYRYLCMWAIIFYPDAETMGGFNVNVPVIHAHKCFLVSVPCKLSRTPHPSPVGIYSAVKVTTYKKFRVICGAAI